VKKILPWIRGAVIGTSVVLTAWFCSPTANASGIIYQFDDVFSFSGSASSPAGPGPWVDATLQDTANGVLLTVNNPGLSGGEFLSELYLNINPADNVNSLTFTPQGGTSGVSAPTIQTGEDGYKADGDGKYDILFSFATSNPGRFGAGDSLTYLIAGIAGLSSGDFEYKSTPAGGHGPFFGAAHIQGIAGETGSDSVWIDPSLGPEITPVPEPAPMALLAGSLGLWAVWRLRVRSVRLQTARIRSVGHPISRR
jgi:hypothetical protein